MNVYSVIMYDINILNDNANALTDRVGLTDDFEMVIFGKQGFPGRSLYGMSCLISNWPDTK